MAKSGVKQLTGAKIASKRSRDGKAVRSERTIEVPWYKADGKRAPTAEELLAHGGLEATRTLTPDEAKRILKVEDDFTTVTDNLVQTYEEHHATLGLSDLSPELLKQMHDRAVYSTARAKIFQAAAEIAAAQANVSKSDLLNAGLRIRRRAHALSEEQPEVLEPWAFFEAYAVRRFPGRGAGNGAMVDEPPSGNDTPSNSEETVLKRATVGKTTGKR